MDNREKVMGRLDGKVAVITGGAGDIGKSAGALFAAEGADVLLVDLNEQALETAVAEIGCNRVSYCVADVARREDNDKMIAVAEERYGGVDAFLANAGVEGQVKPITEYDVDVFDKVLAVNVRGVWLGLKSTIPAMGRRGGGSIIITSSVAGVAGTPGVSAYVTSKHAVIGMMRTAALECASMNIRVNTVNPSPVDGRMMRSLEEGFAPGEGEVIHDRLKESIPLGRYGEPEDIARLMLFLASDDASFITGSVYMADGGSTSG